MLHGYIPPHRFLPYLSWTAIDGLPDKADTVIVLPVGAIEQHGPHLPCSVDSVIASGVLGKALEKLPASIPAFGMAPITYGKSDEHLHFPGTMTLTGPTLLASVTEIGESVYRAGFRKLLLANGHGGQPQVLEMAARELRLRHGDFLIVPFHVSRLPNASGRFISDEEKRLAMHAGHSETALMLALAPDTVHMERAVANVPPVFPSKLLSADGRPACAWTARDFGPSGIIGNPLGATREQGLEILDTLSDSWVQAITDLHQMRWIERDAGSWEHGHQQGHIERAPSAGL
ncbi:MULTISPECIES: creatininase family protein [Ramlibacter]|uniref:Creatininase family protein n=1 Tax=Ramlibacter pinisoli TaxID=2682844 RepID=A0A6N8IX02_9BURK|nr:MULTISPECIES: creatininase family protein [Ramlibacter]MBA2961237.1 creatininase family protein [Ramlibacter sp. CGMCC 1.13660]MVQ31182.1 creatininase family protein [Ramlibacter pinisoli]